MNVIESELKRLFDNCQSYADVNHLVCQMINVVDEAAWQRSSAIRQSNIDSIEKELHDSLKALKLAKD